MAHVGGQLPVVRSARPGPAPARPRPAHPRLWLRISKNTGGTGCVGGRSAALDGLRRLLRAAGQGGGVRSHSAVAMASIGGISSFPLGVIPILEAAVRQPRSGRRSGATPGTTGSPATPRAAGAGWRGPLAGSHARRNSNRAPGRAGRGLRPRLWRSARAWRRHCRPTPGARRHLSKQAAQTVRAALARSERGSNQLAPRPAAPLNNQIAGRPAPTHRIPPASFAGSQRRPARASPQFQ